MQQQRMTKYGAMLGGPSKHIMSTGRKVLNIYAVLAMILIPVLMFTLYVIVNTFSDDDDHYVMYLLLLYLLFFCYILIDIIASIVAPSVTVPVPSVGVPEIPDVQIPILNIGVPPIPDINVPCCPCWPLLKMLCCPCCVPGLCAPELPGMPGVYLPGFPALGIHGSIPGIRVLFNVGMCWLMLIAVIVATIVAIETRKGMAGVYDLSKLNTYRNLDPSLVRGEQMMDAGKVEFKLGSHVNVLYSQVFKEEHMYCVAPIALYNASHGWYDAWAVGRDCCTSQAGFQCGDYNLPHARQATRSLDAEARPYYRLAVQQAEATYGIKAYHPIFFEWRLDAFGETSRRKQAAAQSCAIFSGIFFIFQLLVVFCVVMYFVKNVNSMS